MIDLIVKLLENALELAFNALGTEETKARVDGYVEARRARELAYIAKTGQRP